MLVLKLWYLFYFASASCLQPFLPLIFRRAGLSESQVGTIAALRPWCGVIFGSLLSGIADKFRIHSHILTICFALSVCIRLSISQATTFPAILTVILIADAINSPTNIIVDAAAIAACDASTQNTNSNHSTSNSNKNESEAYGRQRLFGAIGWGAFSFISGTAQTWFHGSSTAAFVLYGILAVATLLPTLRIPWGPLHAKLEEKHHHHQPPSNPPPLHYAGAENHREEEEEGVETRSGGALNSNNNTNQLPSRHGGLSVVMNRSRETSPLRHAFDGIHSNGTNGITTTSPLSPISPQKHHHQHNEEIAIKNKNFCQKLSLLLSSPEALLFFSTVTVMGYAVGTIESFLFLFLEDLGGTESLMGLTLTVTCIAETIVFYYATNIMNFLTLDGCFHLCFVAFLVRLGSYATLAHWKTPWAVLVVELLHGITFGLTWSAGTAKSALIAPPGLEATTQSAFQGFMFGLGYGMGGYFAGRKYHSNGPEAVFKSAFIVVAVGWVVTTAVGWCLRKYGWISIDNKFKNVEYSEVEMSDGGGRD